MNALGQPNLIQKRNLIWFDFCAMVLNDDAEDDEILDVCFPAERRSKQFVDLKGHFLATY